MGPAIVFNRAALYSSRQQVLRINLGGGIHALVVQNLSARSMAALKIMYALD